MEAEKVNGVLSQPQPKNVKDIRKFLGLANYYRRFIKDFTRVVRPMNINELKQVFTIKPVLAVPDLDKEFRMKADASNYATGGVLSMKCLDKK